MKREVKLLVIFFFIFVISFQASLAENHEQGQGTSTDLPPDVTAEEAGEAAQTAMEQGQNIKGDMPPDTTIKPSSGPVAELQGEGQFSYQGGNLDVEQVDYLETRDGQGVIDAEGVSLSKDGVLEADSVGQYGNQGIFEGRELTNFKYDGNSGDVTVFTGKNLLFTKPYKIFFSEVGEASFKVDRQGNLLSWSVEYPRAMSYVFDNPLSTGLTDADNTVPDVIPTPFGFDFFGGNTIGSAVQVVNNDTDVVDAHIGVWGERGAVFGGDNEEFMQPRGPSPQLDFWVTGQGRIDVGHFGLGRIYTVNTSEGFAGMKYQFEVEPDNTYFGTALNSSYTFRFNEWKEILEGEVIQFQLDLFEGFYNHNFVSSPGFYSFEYLDLKSIHQKEVSGKLSQWMVRGDKHFGQNFKLIRPEEGKQFDLFIDKFTRRASLSKFEAQYGDSEGSAYVSLFNNHKVIFNGVVDYLRYNFNFMFGDPRTRIAITGDNPPYFSITHADYEFYPIIESKDPNNHVELDLRAFNTQVHALIDNPSPTTSPIFNAYFPEFLIYELPAQPVTKRFLRWHDKRWPFILRSLQTTGHPLIQPDEGAYSFDNNGYDFTIFPSASYEPNGVYEHPFMEGVHRYMDNNHLCFTKLEPVYFANKPGLTHTIPDWFESEKTLTEWQYEQTR
tara:strand:+ start:4396 stop:6396 length:2001 start_codon:yes stop_codon:yes gene_type:complete